MSQKTVVIVIFISLLLLGLVGYLLFDREYTFNGVLYQDPKPAPEFELHNAGGVYRLADQRGKVALIFFGYTSCPDVCPSSLSDMKRVVSDLEDWTEKVAVIFVTVDPERDSVEKLDAYVSLFQPEFEGLSGSIEELTPVWESYGVIREIDRETGSMAGYLINHTARIYLVDQEGRLLLTYGFGKPPDEIREDVEHLIWED